MPLTADLPVIGCLGRDEVAKASVLNEELNKAVGGCKEEQTFKEAAAYFSGYLVHKLNSYHKKKLSSTIVDYETCAAILDVQDLNLHMFTSFKEYEQNLSSSWSLNYYNRSFIYTIVLLETIYVNLFNKHGHVRGFTFLVRNTLASHCKLPEFCCKDIGNQFFCKL